MKVRAGRLTDEDRRIVFESNRNGKPVLVATEHGCVTYDQRGNTGCQEPMQAVGVVTGWTYENFQVGGWSFATSIPWESALKVWWRSEEPSQDEVAAYIEEHRKVAAK